MCRVGLDRVYCRAAEIRGLEHRSCGECFRELGLFRLALGVSCVLFFVWFNGWVWRRQSQALLKGAWQKGEEQCVQLTLKKITDEYREVFSYSVVEHWKGSGNFILGVSKHYWTN